MALFSQYLSWLAVPCPGYRKDKGCFRSSYPVFKMFPVRLILLVFFSFCSSVCIFIARKLILLTLKLKSKFCLSVHLSETPHCAKRLLYISIYIQLICLYNFDLSRNILNFASVLHPLNGTYTSLGDSVHFGIVVYLLDTDHH